MSNEREQTFEKILSQYEKAIADLIHDGLNVDKAAKVMSLGVEVRAAHERDLRGARTLEWLKVDSLTNPRLPEFLRWVADRLVEVHGESPNLDFIQALRRAADSIDAELVRR